MTISDFAIAITATVIWVMLAATTAALTRKTFNLEDDGDPLVFFTFFFSIFLWYAILIVLLFCHTYRYVLIKLYSKG